MPVNNQPVKHSAAPSSLALRLVRLFHELGPAYTRWVAASIPRDGLSPARMKLLLWLLERGPLSMRELKQATGSTAANITKLVDGLEADGLVERLADAEDRRVTRIRATAKARRETAKDWEAFEHAAARVFDRMKPEDREALARGVEALHGLLVDSSPRAISFKTSRDAGPLE